MIGTSVASTTTPNIWITYAPSIIAIAALLVSFVATLITLNYNRREKIREAKRNEIYKKLNEFYGPLLYLIEKSRLLFQAFGQTYKTTGDFQTLLFLLDNDISTLSSNDKALLDEILEVGKKCEAILEGKSGLIDDVELGKQFSTLGTHILVIRLACEGKLSGQSHDFKKYVFPEKINALIDNKIKSLQVELSKNL